MKTINTLHNLNIETVARQHNSFLIIKESEYITLSTWKLLNYVLVLYIVAMHNWLQ